MFESKYIGVIWVKNQKKWKGQVCYRGKRHYLGISTDEKVMALKVNEKCIELGIPPRNPELIPIKKQVTTVVAFFGNGKKYFSGRTWSIG